MWWGSRHMKDIKWLYGKTIKIRTDDLDSPEIKFYNDGSIEFYQDMDSGSWISIERIFVSKEEVIKLFNNIDLKEFIKCPNTMYQIREILNKFNIEYERSKIG